jgi:predicted transcriptional regulator
MLTDQSHNIDELFGMLSNQTRLEILELCSKGQYSVTDLASSLKLPEYVINKHLNLLVNESLLEKNSKTFYLSTYGELIFKKCSSISFLNRNQKFFEDHDFCEIPSPFMQRIGELEESRLIVGAHIMYSYWTRICKEAKRHIFCIFSYPPILVSEPIKQQIDSGLEVRLLFARGTKVLETNEFVCNLRLNQHSTSENLHKRRVNKVLPSLVLTENECTLMFPDGRGSTDFHANFVSKDSKFHRWCLDFFNYEWENGESFSRFKAAL